MDTTIPPDAPQKQCTGPCQRVLPATSDFFNKHSRGGLQPRCNECRKKDRKIYNDAHVEENRRSRQRYYQENHEEVLAKQEQYRETHREEVRTSQKHYYRTHREEVLIQDRQHYRSHLEKEHARNKRYREAHPEKELARQRQYYRTHLEKERVRGRVNTQKRSARKKNLEGTLTVQQIQAKLKAQKYACYYAACGHAQFKKRKDGTYIYHLDHIIPISRPEFAPRHDASYIVLACPHCNLSKHNKLPSEWPQGGRLF